MPENIIPYLYICFYVQIIQITAMPENNCFTRAYYGNVQIIQITAMPEN